MKSGTVHVVDLAREFLRLDEAEPAGDDLPVGRESTSVPWDSVLNHRVVVLLGEAGSGKTTELREQAARLTADGRFAFFLKVEDLDRDGLPDALGPLEQERFGAWQASDRPAHFFVDSIDEARLSNVKLSRAVKQLARVVLRHMNHAHVVLSCRGSDWRHREDVDALARELRPPAWDDFKVHLFSLAPLTLSQVELLAAHHGVAEPTEFRRAAEEAAVSAFLGRPGDVLSMISYWNDHRRFGSLAEMVEADVTEKLRERNTDRMPSLTPQRARSAVAAAAGLAQLAGASTFASPDVGPDVGRGGACLALDRVFPDFTKNELRELLTLPIFDVATYGRVRIHHRSVGEYLAAQWLVDLIDRGLPRSDLEELLFWPGPDGPVVSLRWAPIVAWMAARDPVLCRTLIEADPVALLRAGDPAQLPAEALALVLDAIVARYSDRQRFAAMLDESTLRRFAMVCSEKHVNGLLENAASGDIQSLLLQIARLGRMLACVDVATRIATCAGSSRSRWEAIEMVMSVGTPAHIEAMLRVLIDDAPSIDHEVGGAVVFHGYPHMGVVRLLALLERVDEPPPHTGTMLVHALEDVVVASTPRADRERLMSGVHSLLLVPLRPPEIVPRYQWFVSVFAGMLAAWATQLGDSEITYLAPYLRFFTELAHYGHLPDELGDMNIRRLLDGDARVRRALFWWDIEQARRSDSRRRPATDYHDCKTERRLWRLGAADAEWLAEDASGRPHVTDRLLAFNALRELPCAESAVTERDAVVRALAAGDNGLRLRLERWVRGGASIDALGAKKYERLHQAHLVRRARRDAENRRILCSRIERIRDGTDQQALAFLLEQGVVSKDNDHRSKAIETYGSDLAAAAHEGLMRMWRSVQCPLEHEVGDHGRAEVARRGLMLEIDAGLDLDSLDAATAELVARHAAARLNGLPKWIDRLARAHSAAVGRVLEACIDAEYRCTPSEQIRYRVLAHLGREPIEVRRLCRPFVLSRLVAAEPARVDTLTHALDALLAAEQPLDELAPLVPMRFAAAIGPAWKVVWWRAWLAIEPAGAVDALEAELASDDDKASAFMLLLCDELWSPVDREAGLPTVNDASLLGRLVELACKRIRPEDDVQRISGTYGPRDEAEDVRDSWVRQLTEQTGLSAVREMRRVSGLPQCAAMRDWLLSAADDRLRDLASSADAPLAQRILAAYEKHGLVALGYAAQMGTPWKEQRLHNVDVVVLTAIELEYRAALRVDAGAEPEKQWTEVEFHGLPVATREFRGRNGRPLRIAVARAADMGKGAAVTTLLPLVDHLRPSVIAMCGVCAGRAGKTALGDVIAGERLYDHDAGKITPSGLEADTRTYSLPAPWKVALERFDPVGRFGSERWWIERPRPIEWQEAWVLVQLRAGVADLDASVDRDARCPQWPDVISHLWARGDLERGDLQLTSQGRVRASEFALKYPDFPDLSPRGTMLPFRLHVAPIGSGSPVIEDESVWAVISNHMRKTLGIEMEASALADIVRARPGLQAVAMKGVMDFANHGRDDQFKEYAARASAECLMAFLRDQLPEPQGASGG